MNRKDRTRSVIMRGKIDKIAGVIIALFCSIGLSKSAFAATTINVSRITLKKNIMQDVYLCYKQGGVKKTMNPLSKFKNLNSLMASGANNKKVRLITGAKFNQYQVFFEKNYGKIGCKQFFIGHDSDSETKLFTELGKAGDIPNNRSSGTTIGGFMEKMGYKVTGEAKGDCYTLPYTLTAGGKSVGKSINRVCKRDGKVVAEADKNTGRFEDSSFTNGKDDSEICLQLLSLSTGATSQTEAKNMGCKKAKAESFNGDFLIALVKESCGSMKCVTGDGAYTFTFDSTAKKQSDGTASAGNKTDSPEDYSAKWSNYKTAGLKAIDYLSDGTFTTVDSVRIKGLEKRILYQAYLTDYFGVAVDCGENQSDAAFDGKIDWFDASSMSMKKCHYSKANAINKDGTVNAVRDSSGFLTTEIKGLEAMIKAINALEKSYSEEEIEAAKDIIAAISEGGAEPNEDASTCASAGGAGSLGWIVCPVLEWLGDVAEGVYNDYVEPALQVSPKLFTGGDDATLNAWSTFRDIANVVFVIVLLVVIFSQLTGVGIDNYGIKKILPKLVVMAVLVNLSYVLCILAVDISNILGNGFQSMFDGMSQQLSSSVPPQYTINTDAGTSEPIDAGAITGLTGVGILGMIVAGGLAIWASPAILISLLIAAIGVAVSIFFLFILLSARQAAILVMVIMSPIAVVMYVLPNTKKLFDRWLKMFEGLLLVYPISGLLVGAGGYVSRLLIATGASSGDFIWSFMAMVVSIVPIFFIPTVLKGAFSAMGKMGGTLAGLGAGASVGAKRIARTRGGEIATKVRGTDTYRGLRNGIAMHSLFSRRREFAVNDAIALAKEREQRKRWSDTDTMQTRIDSARAAEVAKAREEAVGQRLSLMQSNGITMKDGKQYAFTLDSAKTRMSQLEDLARTNELDKKQKDEMAALARGMSGMKGGGGALGKIVRGAKGANGVGANQNFMKAMGEIYAKDSAVKSKMDEKDVGAAAYTETFMPNGKGGEDSFEDFKEREIPDPNDNSKKIKQYQQIMNDRIKTHEAGLNQSGTAATEYLNDRMSDEDVMKFASDSQRLNKLEDNGIRNALEQRADTIKAKKASSGGGTVTPKPSTGGSSILTGSAASDAFKSGRSSGEFHLPN